MAKRNYECGKAVTGKIRPSKHTISPSKKMYNCSPSPAKGELVTERLSPVRVRSPSSIQGSSPRTSSPGAGHYAGCKWTEPPSPSALPLPPQHWMQASHSIVLPFHPPIKHDIAQQLKVLLKVHA